jgi:hypothetical protein
MLGLKAWTVIPGFAILIFLLKKESQFPKQNNKCFIFAKKKKKNHWHLAKQRQPS